jgi:uncharacterized membrane protein SirB2
VSIYLAVKNLHVLCAVLSGTGFVLQGIWMMMRSPVLEHRVTRTLPHVIDTIFLASAITLAVMSAQYPFVAPWLTAKVIGLLVYILLGAVALRRGRTMRIRVLAFVGAVALFGWIVSVALSRNPAGILTLIGAF